MLWSSESCSAFISTPFFRLTRMSALALGIYNSWERETGTRGRRGKEEREKREEETKKEKRVPNSPLSSPSFSLFHLFNLLFLRFSSLTDPTQGTLLNLGVTSGISLVPLLFLFAPIYEYTQYKNKCTKSLY